MDRDKKDMGVVMAVVLVRIQRWSLQTSPLLAADLGSFLTKRSASTCSPHPSPSTNGDDAPVDSIVKKVLEESVETVIEHTQEQPELEGIHLIIEFDSEVHVVVDPTLRIPIERFHPDISSEVRRAYLLKGPS
uniref:Uncharacterized protein n=1 Tax=Oryza punctata TaxID=4537 RepID=A0A0E0LYA9_ORYPU